LPAIISHNLGASGGFFGRRHWDFSAHGFTPGAWAVRSQTGDAPERDRKYLKKNDNFPV
jgi:hypothetical protein